MRHKISLLRLFLPLLLTLTALSAYGQKTYVVAVGLSRYMYPKVAPPLPCSVNDARAVSEFFHSYNGSEVFMLVNENATRNHILRVLRQQFAKATAKDEIIFMFSGHGLQGGLTCYESKDMNSIVRYEEIQKIMQSAKARRKVILAMACYSGGLALRGGNGSGNYRGANDRSSVMLYTSSRPNEVSWENSSMRNSFFIARVLEAFRGAADRNGDRKVTARELFNYVNPRVERDTDGQQHPQLIGRFDDSMVVVYVK